MEKFAPDVGPELVHQVHAGIAQQRKSDASRDRMHALALSRNIKIGDRA